MPRPRTVLAAVAAGALLLAPAAAPAALSPVHLRGTAYELNNVHRLLAGATIRVEELPGAQATVRHDGTYDLVVPDRMRVTPYIVAPGYRSIHLQTFTTDGEDLADVNFQTPTEAVAGALSQLLGVPTGPDGAPTECVIVSTFSTRNVRDLGFAGFIGYGAHGVAGATASASPALPPPVYFNKDVVPDRSQRRSSVDGGVVWTGVPTGVYTITAHSRSTRFAPFTATCAPGRIVNANPPWGLHELGLANPAVVRATWSAGALRSLTARSLPPKTVVRVSCRGRGRGCGFTTRTIRPRGRTADLAAALGPRRAAWLGAGSTLEVAIAAHRYDGKVLRWRIGAHGVSRSAPLCVPLGMTKPRARC